MTISLTTLPAKVGKIAPFPPLPGQPYPPSRNHPRWKELYKLHDEWLMKYWPFSSEKKRARIPIMYLAGFSTWCAPAADFDRMVRGARLGGVFFMSDDYVDSGRMLDRIPGFKQAATGSGPLHPEDRAEICHDIVFRAIRGTCMERTFQQLVRCTHEWWDSNVHEPYSSLDQYIANRRVNIAMYFANAYFRYTLDINLTDEQIDHPLIREAEGIVSDHVGLTNDLFSYAKERMTDSDDTNILRILQDHENITYEKAKSMVEQKILDKERDYITAGMAVLNDPVLGQDPEVRRWIASLPYCMGGNKAWSQESGRYNIGDTGGIEFPFLPCAEEDTPEDEVVDPTADIDSRNFSRGFKDAPPPDFTLDVAAIESVKGWSNTNSALPVSLSLPRIQTPRPQDAGILAIEPYIVNIHSGNFNPLERDTITIATLTVASLISKYSIDISTIGRLEIVSDAHSTVMDTMTDELLSLFKDPSVAVGYSRGKGIDTLFLSINWIESPSWDGRNVILFAGNTAADSVAILVGSQASIVVEPFYGVHTAGRDGSDELKTAVEGTYLSYTDKYMSALRSVSEPIAVEISASATVTSADLDFIVHGVSDAKAATFSHAYMLYQDHIVKQAVNGSNGSSKSSFCENFIETTATDFEQRVLPTTKLLRHRKESSAWVSIFIGVASILAAVPGYDLFEKRVGVFDYSPRSTSVFFVLRVKGNTSLIHQNLRFTSKYLG